MHPKAERYNNNELNESEVNDDVYDKESERIFDTHTINAETGDMTEKEVVHFCTLLRECIATKFSIKSKFKVNTITAYDKEAKKRVAKGVSFIYWEKSEVYHILLGRNPDGSERFKLVYVDSDGDEIDPIKYKLKETMKSNSFDDRSSDSDGSLSKSDAWDEGMSFADTMDASGKKKRSIQEALNAGLVPPGYRVQKRNDIGLLPPFVYTRTNKAQAMLNGLDSSVQITMNPFFITSNGSEPLNVDYNKLSSDVPKGTTVAELHALFDIFSSHPNYPNIIIKKAAAKNTNETRDIAFITFHPRYTEARFARALMLFTPFQVGKESVTKRFDHPWSRGIRIHS